MMMAKEDEDDQVQEDGDKTRTLLEKTIDWVPLFKCNLLEYLCGLCLVVPKTWGLSM